MEIKSYILSSLSHFIIFVFAYYIFKIFFCFYTRIFFTRPTLILLWIYNFIRIVIEYSRSILFARRLFHAQFSSRASKHVSQTSNEEHEPGCVLN